MRLRAKDRKEVKGRFPPELYALMQDWKRLECIEEDSSALVRMATLFLCGVKGILPVNSESVSAGSAQSGTRR